MTIERHRGAIRFALIYMTVAMGAVAVYILLAPRTFYDDFPGWAQWVSALPPYNEHLLRDFGSAGLGLAVLAGVAAAWLDRRLVQAAAIALFAGTLPHTLYHFTTTGSYSTADNVLSLGGLVLQTVLPLLVLYLASGARQSPTTSTASAPAQSTPKEA
ncbi:MAG: hypothetical protein ACRDL6_05120 [Solirubrobacterales bacterium]